MSDDRDELQADIDDLRKQLEDARDLTEWLKHALSEQAWHFRATVEALQLQYRHDVKRLHVDQPVEAARREPVEAQLTRKQRSAVAFGDADGGNVARNPYSEGQRS